MERVIGFEPTTLCLASTFSNNYRHTYIYAALLFPSARRRNGIARVLTFTHNTSYMAPTQIQIPKTRSMGVFLPCHLTNLGDDYPITKPFSPWAK